MNEYCTPKRCPQCGSVEIETTDLIHECIHIKVYQLVCLNCEFEFVGLCYPNKEIAKECMRLPY